MTDEQLKLARETIRDLIDVCDDTATIHTNHVDRLKKQKEVVEAAETAFRGLLRQ